MEEVNLSISNDEALVLFELLSRFTDEEKLSVDNKAEQQVLFNLQTTLEQTLTAPLQPNYSSLLNKAGRNLGGNNE